MKVGIFGGSFDPVHNEHISIAVGAIKELSLDKLYVIPTYIAPHKKNKGVAPGEHRLKMLEIAFAGVDKVEISNYELLSGGVSYTYLTIGYFKELYPTAELYFLTGSDMLENFPTWKNPEKIVANANLVLASRENGQFDDDLLINRVESLYNAKVIKINAFGTTVSSTAVRTYIKLGLNPSGLIPNGVYEYAVKNELYSEDKLYSYVKKTLPEKRRVHTAGVILKALELAKKLGVDESKIETAALLHDVAKYKLRSDYLEAEIPLNVPDAVVHQYLSEYIAKNELKIDDEEILNAIKYHTTGRANMSLIEKIIYIADLIEPSRKFLGVDELRKAIDNDFDSGFKICLKEIVEFLKKDGEPVFELTLEAAKFYLEDN